eukprot:g13528.t1
MNYAGKTAIDAIIFIAAAAVSLVCIGHIAVLWALRRNFFIVMRVTEESTKPAEIAHVISMPALLTAEVALILTAVRLLIMYYPSERARWGRFTREKPLAYALVALYILTEMSAWSAAWRLGMTSVAAAVKTLRPVSALITVIAGVGLGGRLKRVNDANNMSHDIRLVGSLLIAITCFHAMFQTVQLISLVRKYVTIGLLFVTNPTINWICIIRPVREAVRNIPRPRRNAVEALLVAPLRKSSSTVAVTTDSEYILYRKGSACDANRLVSIMGFLPLREAFGEFCRRSLCSESFQFLLDVSEFQNNVVLEESNNNADERGGFRGFGSFLAIVNDYIKDGAHSEVNIEFKTKRDITRHAKYMSYTSLDLESRKLIFNDAVEEVGKMLVDNLLNRFLESPQYKAVVDFEPQSPA